MPPAILIADDHPLFREALKLAITQAFGGARTFEADTVDSLLATLHAHPEIDLLLLDLGMPGAHGFSGLIQVRAHYPSVPVVVISGREDQDIAQRTLTHGAAAFIAKSAAVPTIIDALQTILQGGVWSPPDLVATAGARSMFIPTKPPPRAAWPASRRSSSACCPCCARDSRTSASPCSLQVSEATVKAHMTAILEKMGAENRTQAVLDRAAPGAASVRAAGSEDDA